MRGPGPIDREVEIAKAVANDPRTLVLAGGQVVGPDGLMETDVLVSDGEVAAVGPALTVGAGVAAIDCTGCWVGPGFVDLHTHLREPGQEWKEDIGSASAAAAAGGFAAVTAMPNTEPPTDRGHLARQIVERGRSVGLVDVVPSGTITMGRSGSGLSRLEELLDAGVRLFTDDGDSVGDTELLRRAMEYLGPRGGIIAQHAVDGGLSGGGHMREGSVSSRLGIKAIPAAAEAVVIRRDLDLVELTGCQYHVQHLSTAEGVDLVAGAKAVGLPVTAEVTPHHLAFTEFDVESADTAFKMMPPLGTGRDRAALAHGVATGVIDAVATDHAPHADHEKDVPFDQAPFGVIGLEWAAAVTHHVLGLEAVDLYDRLSSAPARILSLEEHGRPLMAGSPATIAVFDPNATTTIEAPLSRSHNAPYLGHTYRGSVRATLLRGRVTYSAELPAPAMRNST